MNRFYPSPDYTTSPLRHPFFDRRRPQLLAHRGGSALAPENTIAAFDNGLAHGADGLELDVHLSRDGVVVVHHDPTLDRTTNLVGPIADRTADELARADAGYAFRPSPDLPSVGFPFRGQGVGVPTLADVLKRYPEATIVIELKVNRPELARAVIAVVNRAAAVER